MASSASHESWLVYIYSTVWSCGVYNLEYPFELFEEHECESCGWSHAEERW
jgi:hypothetical protein